MDIREKNNNGLIDIVRGLLSYIQLDDSNIYSLISYGEEILKNNHTSNISDIYSIIFSDILATQPVEGDENYNSSLTVYRIKSYASIFTNIISFKDSHIGEYTLTDINMINMYISIMLKERYKMLNQKSDRKYINSLLDYICDGNSELRNILFQCIGDEYVEI